MNAVAPTQATAPAHRTGALAGVYTIARRELAAYFDAPIAYVFIVIFLLLAGFFTFTFGQFFERGEASLVSFFSWHPWLYLFLVPAVGMRLWAEERRLGTMELLMTMPIAPWQAIVGKYLASWIFIGIALLLTFPLIITVNWLGHPDNGVIIAGYIGSLFMAGAYLAIASMTSALSRNQVVSFVLAVMACLILVMVGFDPVTTLLSRWLSPQAVEAIAAFSVMTHFDGVTKGVLEFKDVVYFASVIGFGLFTTGVIIRSQRA